MSLFENFGFEHQPLTADSPEVEAVIQSLNLEFTWIYYA